MLKIFLFGFLALSTVPANAVTVLVEGDFGPTNVGKPHPGTHFMFEWEVAADFGGSRINTDVAVKVFSFDTIDVAGATYFAANFGATGVGDVYPIWSLSSVTYLSTGERFGTSFLFAWDGQSLAAIPGEFQYVTFEANGGFLPSGVYIWKNPTNVTVSFNADAFIIPAPEPATWVMMIGGFALAGAAMRRQTAVAFA